MLQHRLPCLRPIGRTKPLGLAASKLVSRQELSQRARLSTITGAFLLRPTGDGTSDHLDGQSVPPLQSFLLTQGQFEVGRSAEASISIPIPTVSTRHALLLVGPYSDNVEGEMLLLTDLRSTNGTLVNGVEVEPLSVVELSPGAEVIFGDVHLAKFVVEKYQEEEAQQQQAATGNEQQSGTTMQQYVQQAQTMADGQASPNPPAGQQPMAAGLEVPQAATPDSVMTGYTGVSGVVDDDWAVPAAEDDWAAAAPPTTTTAGGNMGAAGSAGSPVHGGCQGAVVDDSTQQMGDGVISDGQAAGYGYAAAAQQIPTAEELGAVAAAGGVSMMEELVQAAATGQDLMETLSSRSFDDVDDQAGEAGAATEQGRGRALFAQSFKHVHDTSDEEDYAAMRVGAEGIKSKEERDARLAAELEQVAALQQQQQRS